VGYAHRFTRKLAPTRAWNQSLQTGSRKIAQNQPRFRDSPAKPVFQDFPKASPQPQKIPIQTQNRKTGKKQTLTSQTPATHKKGSMLETPAA